MVKEEAKSEPTDDMELVKVTEGAYDDLCRIATLLVWADDLAGDYVDPRVKAWREASAS